MRTLNGKLVLFVLAFLAALAAFWVGQMLRADHSSANRVHTLIHSQLDLDADQKARIAQLEEAFAGQRATLEGNLRTANAELAQAIDREHRYGPKVAQAIDKCHAAMGSLQKATLQHIFAIRAVLRPDQARRLDATVASALTDPATN
ncbi:periplasmic heavy metal sensor [Novosphingobium sp. 1949]|uniref:Periplasmic heavy metal sensor n=1 Tax=Novosphingobium organovorum TaxID=2930092 RepID=A0ABT0BJQ4_9SPHN|nr:periplasmic heavy metal sensor [Novosphingobium organovorum]MCJ2185175.1 periplasmic heavy metal sensor [Novosphingobium organovorum]